MKIALTLVHNKTDEENVAQIDALKEKLRLVEDLHDMRDENGNITGQYATYHHELIGLDVPHEVKVYQAIPFGVTPPSNRYDINSGGIVMYGEGDEDKVGTHPRFFNWGAKRGIDHGAEFSLYLEDITKLNVKALKARLQRKPNFVDDLFGRIISKDEFMRGQLREDKPLAKAVVERKNRIERGISNE